MTLIRHMKVLCIILATSYAAITSAADAFKIPDFEPLDYRVEISTVMKHDDGKFLWYHPRATALPRCAPSGGTQILMTLLQHLSYSDFYSGTYVMFSNDLGKTWKGPEAPPELAWRPEANGIVTSVCDTTPGWHTPTHKVVVIGGQLRYNTKGEQLEDQPRSNQTAYTIYDPKAGTWQPWKLLELPPDKKFNYARSASAQWLVKEDGTLLLPFYFGEDAPNPHDVTVVQCSFDGQNMKYMQHGDELKERTERGIDEPSLAYYGGRYFLTIRHDLRGYVTSGKDGLHFAPIKPWQFDDGSELGSYNTQQHWLVHSDGLFLVYTRKGANNDHIYRNGAPLFIAQVDPSTLRVVRKTERVLIPEHGAEMRNFGAAAINEEQSWVTVSEGVWNDEDRRRGASGATLVAHIYWSKPNRAGIPNN